MKVLIRWTMMKNHGNFLALVQLLAKYDPLLASHLSMCQEKSTKRIEKLKRPGKAGSKGRGALVTFLSKTTISKLLNIMKNMMQEQIAMEVSKAKVYSIQVDSTQDISAIDQFSIVVRYVLNATVHERLLSIVPSNDGTGQGLFDLLNLTLQRLGFNLKYCLSDSTDGASSYHGQYNGLQQKITEAADHHVHTWCYGHVLNLVVKEATSCCIQAVSFFTLLQNVSTFIKVSYKRMATWIKLVETQIGMDKMKRLKLIGEIRWSGKSNAATAIFGTFSEPSSTVFVNLILCLSCISESENFDTKTRHEAKTLLMPFLKFDTILTAFTCLRVFEKVRPLSIYLQTRGLNVLVAFKMVEKAVIELKSQSRLFDDVHNNALQFVRMANASIIQRTETILEVKNYQLNESGRHQRC
ncbi:uncharacterized protein LOC124818104 [Hydra vulgaris]|uniref:uncharacterized protein LOC101237155 n=1 Tax=Hydra vulgaris TaxID=6087 RepID=UPI001F5FF07B|nr:uncharacterized protein LOC101237155 [Hydra vulgaris]XP_047144580.1 uncharacterized protein LOC124818104 [Hydra vulgaris]